jgi:hypothetical protein
MFKYENIKKTYENFIKNYNCYLDPNEIWFNKLNEIKTFIQKHKQRPSAVSKVPYIKSLGIWICHNKKNAFERSYIMKNNDIYNEWLKFEDEYKEYILSGEQKWLYNLQKTIQYIEKNKKLPSSIDKNNDIKILGKWYSRQIEFEKERLHLFQSYSIWNKWLEFKEKYKYLTLNYEEQWILNLEKCIEYIEKYKKIPSVSDKNYEIKILGKWISHQKEGAKLRKDSILSRDNIYKQWIDFSNQYNKFLYKNNWLWLKNLQELETYIDKYQKFPIENKKITKWYNQEKQFVDEKLFFLHNENNYNKWLIVQNKIEKLI